MLIVVYHFQGLGSSGRPKQVKYRNTEYRSFGILTEPNNTEPNLMVHENSGFPQYDNLKIEIFLKIQIFDQKMPKDIGKCVLVATFKIFLVKISSFELQRIGNQARQLNSEPTLCPKGLKIEKYILGHLFKVI